MQLPSPIPHAHHRLLETQSYAHHWKLQLSWGNPQQLPPGLPPTLVPACVHNCGSLVLHPALVYTHANCGLAQSDSPSCPAHTYASGSQQYLLLSVIIAILTGGRDISLWF